MPEFDLLVVGEINPDLILNGNFELQFGQTEKLVDSADLTIGSSSVIFACGAARLGLKTAFAGVCGNDLFGRFMLEKMNERGVDTSAVEIVPGGTTGMSVILNRGADRMILTNPGLIAAMTAEKVSDELLQSARHLHVASYFIQEKLRPGLPGLFQRAKKFGLSISIDTNFDPANQWKGLEDVLPRVDIFFPNEKEALAITKRKSPDEAMLYLSGVCPTTVMKCGERGGKVIYNVRNFLAVGPIKVDVVDTVGAGDSFDAGYIYGHLKGWDKERSLRLAVICGSLSTRAAGGTNAQATLAEAGQYMTI
jgi:sugar/nucleoside kinase (ribokinase family)